MTGRVSPTPAADAAPGRADSRDAETAALERIGFMQGRLSPLVDQRIQAFPWSSWAEEFPAARREGFRMMEWTLDQDRLGENPLLTAPGQAEIRSLSRRHGVRAVSLTGDCWMQAPFWKARGDVRENLHRDFRTIARACASVGMSTMVVPLVDDGRLENAGQEDQLVEFMTGEADSLRSLALRTIFESDFGPEELARFISRLDSDVFGINYDIGNSAALGLDPHEEMSAYGKRVLGVHVKDRLRGGATVPLGTGAADFDAAFAALAHSGYMGSYILQTARAEDGDHAAALSRYRRMTAEWMVRHGA